MATTNRPKVEKSSVEWRSQLTAEQYRIGRQGGTERAFTGPYWRTKIPGTYCCVCCAAALFRSEAKYDSGTGWPSFYTPIAPEALLETIDSSWLMRRTEVRCATCGAHLGHVFKDGPAPTGLRYCVNGTILRLEPDEV